MRPAVAGLVGLFVGLLVGLGTASSVPRTVPPRPVMLVVPTPTPTLEHTREVQRLRQALAVRDAELERLRAAADLGQRVSEAQEEVIADLSDEVTGVAAAWPADLPADRSPAGFPAAVEALAASCGFSDALLDVDCREPPCLAIFDPEAFDEQPWECGAWRERWGNAITSSSGTTECRDGRKVPYVLAGPPVADWVDNPRPEDPWNFMKRFEVREQEAEAVLCAE